MADDTSGGPATVELFRDDARLAQCDAVVTAVDERGVWTNQIDWNNSSLSWYDFQPVHDDVFGNAACGASVTFTVPGVSV